MYYKSDMGNSQPIVRSEDTDTRAVNPAAQIDQILSELSRLYLERFKAMRSDNKTAVQTLTDQIAAFKTILSQI